MLGASAKLAASFGDKATIEHEYEKLDSKIHKLNLLLPQLKRQIAEFFNLSSVKSIFVELDDFYHMPRSMQPHVIDYVHRLCKDVPLYFKVATLRHATTLYADRGGQPTGAQERHDYLPINVDFTVTDFLRTGDQEAKPSRAFLHDEIQQPAPRSSALPSKTRLRESFSRFREYPHWRDLSPMCHPDRLSGQARGNHVLRMPSADYSPTGDSKSSWNLCKREPSL